MVTFVFTKYAERRFLKLPQLIRHRMAAKLQELKKHEDIFSILKPLHHFSPATHRLRVGIYRLILELKKQKGEYFEFWVLDLGPRKDIYRP